MKLYFSPGACSLSVHIALEEVKARYEAVQVDLKTHTLKDGGNYYDISPRGYVPLLELDDGSRHTEAASLLQYVADLDPQQALIGAGDRIKRLRIVEWLAFISTEMHKTFGLLFNKELPDGIRATTMAKVEKRLKELDALLGRQDYLSETFSVADGYAFTILNWCNVLKVPLDPYPNVRAYMQRVSARPHVRAALQAEGLGG
jgi:glutathione S-transferase